jgi:nucleotide-binding universal stress UspA family protein
MERILVAVDFSDVTPELVRVAGELARALGAELFLVHVEPADPQFVGYEAGPQNVRDAVAERLRRQHRDLQTLAEGLRARGARATPLLVQGYAVDKLCEEAGRLGAQLIVMGTHGHGRVHRLLLGSVGEGVLRRATCPVMFVPLDRAAPAA